MMRRLGTQEDQASKAEGGPQSEPVAGTWAAPATGLMWAKRDNGSDVNWQQAADYCRNLQLAEHRDWGVADDQQVARHL